MELSSLTYFCELTKDLNFTKTAARLFLSQQTLSNHIQRLENELGEELLTRKPVLALTPAGEQFLNYARTVTREYENVRSRIADIGKQDRGAIRFGASTLRLSSCLPAILPRFTERYPNVELRISDSISRQLIPQVIRGDIEIAIVMQDQDIPVLKSTLLMEDWLYLCVSDSLLKKYYGEYTEELKDRAFHKAWLRNFGDLPFCLYSNFLGDRVRGLFEEANIVPKILMTTTYTQIGMDLCLKGLTACVATQMNLTNLPEIPPDINVFPLYHGDVPQAQTIRLIRREDRYLPAYTMYFMDLLNDYFQSVEAISIKQKA